MLAIGAMIVGGGFAFATANNSPDYNVYFDGDNWLPLDEDVEYHCQMSSNNCIGESTTPDDPLAEPEIIKKGTFTRGPQ